MIDSLPTISEKEFMKNHTFLTIIIASLIFMGGVMVGKMSIHSNGDVKSAVENAAKSAITGTPDTAENPASITTTQAATPNNGSSVAFTLNIANLSASQKALLRTMGITGDTVPVTNNMLICAESALGVERTTAIKNGATPTVAENLKLVACYK